MTRTALTALALTAALAGPAAAQYAYEPIPAPRYEPVPPPPPGAYLWEPGHWRWARGGYAWVPGRYVPQAVGYREFVPGHWQQFRHGPPVWVEAHWR